MADESVNVEPGIQLPKSGKSDQGEKKKKKKKKRKFSRGLEEMQRMERAFTSVDKRVVKAVLAGVQTWESSSNKSSRRKRDGALADATKNAAKAYAKYAKLITSVPSATYPDLRDTKYFEDLFRY